MTYYMTVAEARRLKLLPKKNQGEETPPKRKRTRNAPETPPVSDVQEEQTPVVDASGIPGRGVWCKSNLGDWQSQGGWRVGFIREWVKTEDGSEPLNRLVVWHDLIPHVFRLCTLEQFLKEQWTVDQLLTQIKEAYTHWCAQQELQEEESEEAGEQESSNNESRNSREAATDEN